MHAYILCQLDRSVARDVQQRIGSKPPVIESRILFGEWDLIVEIEAKNQQRVSDFVIDELRGDEDISLTSTLIAAE
jgi:DNA-binding Lrp family transcriptional regulator